MTELKPCPDKDLPQSAEWRAGYDAALRETISAADELCQQRGTTTRLETMQASAMAAVTLLGNRRDAERLNLINRLAGALRECEENLHGEFSFGSFTPSDLVKEAEALLP